MMNWIKALEKPGHLGEAIIHFNNATVVEKNDTSSVEVVRMLSDTLNKIQTEWSLQKNQENGEIKTFKTMISDAIDLENQAEFLRSCEVKNLVDLRPQIMNHQTLRHNGYRPDVQIEPDLVKRASKEHRKFCATYNDFLSEANDERQKPVLERIAELLYIVRSNIAHGEKTPYGPDFKKRERDESVCRVVAPIQKLLVNLLLDKPDQKLIVYGTLAQGQPNHDILEHLNGSFEECEVKGRIAEMNELLFFDWFPGGERVKAKLFTSSGLPSHWKDLDRFEGEYYKRILVPTEKADSLSIANIYVTNKNAEVSEWEQ